MSRHPFQIRTLKNKLTIAKQIEDQLCEDYRKEFGVTRVPSEEKTRFGKISLEVAETFAEGDLKIRANQIARGLISQDDLPRIVSERLGNALEGVRLVSTASDMKEILKENAQLLHTKFKALIEAGFSEDQSFQLILAEVTAKKSR